MKVTPMPMRRIFVPGSRREGFTLVELLVVIAIIGVLVALLLPAVQAAREASRRTKCINNLKQWAIGVHNYNDTFGYLPIGGADSGMPRRTFVSGLYPFIEQTALANQYNNAVGFWEPPNIVQNSTNGLICTQINIMACPSDRKGYWKGDVYWRSRGSYVVNMGNTRAATTDAASAPFKFNTFTKLAQVSDGTSNTLLMSEVIMAPTDEANDCRGDVYNDDDGFFFTTVNTPNTGVDICQICASPVATSTMPPPCQVGSGYTGASAVMVSARSKHPAGVACAAFDGSVQFVTNSIALGVWQGLGSSANGEAAQFP